MTDVFDGFAEAHRAAGVTRGRGAPSSGRGGAPRRALLAATRSALTSLALAFALAGCGDVESLSPLGPTTSSASGGGGAGGEGGGAGGGAAGGGGGCATLTPTQTTIDFASVAWIGLAAKVDAPLAGYAKTRLAMELYEDDGSGALPPLAPGSFALGAAPDDDYGTCQHCVLLVAYDEANRPRRVFFEATGTMELTKVDPNKPGIVVGAARDVHLTEITQDQDLSWHPAPGGVCFDVPRWSFDTRPVDGGPCLAAEDCPNAATQICDPKTKTCGPAQCSLTGDPPFCGADAFCLSQAGALLDQDASGPAIGACYTTCTPAASGGCAADETCLPLGPTQDLGVCLAKGDAPVGAPCASPDVSTGCEAGSVCVGEIATCAALCDYLTPAAGCPADTYCSQRNVCEPLSAGDGALPGEACAATTPELSDCGASGDAFRGLCVRFFPDDPVTTCERMCRTASPDCPAGETCLSVFSNMAVGVCHAKPVCGDGVVDVVGGEVCDDGNATSGDGCGADCATPELDALCAKAPALTLDTFVAGSTEGGPRGYASTCDPFIATPTAAYTFTPPGPGRLSLELDTARALGLSVLADCADDTTELACREGEGTTKVHVDFAAASATPALVVVRGASPLDAGAFGLVASFEPAVCGDGKVGGPEACDDGNTASGDGCAGDCSAIEWGPLCAALPALDVSAPQNGDLTGGATAFDSSGTCAAFVGGGLARAYTFTAPSAGTLSLKLDAAADLVLYVEKGCGPVATREFVTCANSAFAGQREATDAALDADEQVTVIVQGFLDGEGGPYKLTAAFAP